MRVIVRHRRPSVGGFITALLSGAALIGCGSTPIPTPGPATVVVDDFEGGDLSAWRTVAAGAGGGWYAYTDGTTSPDASLTNPGSPFRMPDPPEGSHAATTDMNAPGALVLYRDVRLDGSFDLSMSVFYRSERPFSTPDTLAYDAAKANQQFRVDVISPSAPIDSVAAGDVLLNVFRTAPGDPLFRAPEDVAVDVSSLAGQTVRLRLAVADNQGPLRAGVDHIRFEPTGSGEHAVDLLETPEASDAVDLLLHRMSETDALAALTKRADEALGDDAFSGALLVARDGAVLLERAWGRAVRDTGTPNTVDTKFRIGSMNKMFTSIATLQLVEAGKLALDEPIGTYLPDYPNLDIRSNVTIRHLLSHTGGTGDIFGPQYEQRRLELREHNDYVELYGARGPQFEPGSRFEYSNYGFVLLGAVIEAVTGKPYYDVVRENVFEPAGMTATDSLPESESVDARSVGYMGGSGGGGWRPNTDTLPWRGTAAGGGYSTVDDLLRFAEALRTGTLISKASLAEATRPQSAEPYGFAMELRGEGTLRSYGHGGGAPGMNGDLRIYPELGYVVVGLSNLDPPAASSLVDFFTERMPDG
jgi:CubicO group peptidase (beta-lactamase class C family)